MRTSFVSLAARRKAGLHTSHASLVFMAEARQKAQLNAFSGAIDQLETRLEPLLAVPRNELSGQISGLENAKLNLATSYTACSLYYMFLKTRGVAPHAHPVKAELDRVQLYMKKLAAHEKKSAAAAAAAAAGSSDGGGNGGGGGGGGGSSGAAAATASSSSSSSCADNTPAGRMIHGAMHSDALWQGAVEEKKKEEGAQAGAGDSDNKRRGAAGGQNKKGGGGESGGGGKKKRARNS
jgi:exosome complex protein LRP1